MLMRQLCRRESAEQCKRAFLGMGGEGGAGIRNLNIANLMSWKRCFSSVKLQR